MGRRAVRQAGRQKSPTHVSRIFLPAAPKLLIDLTHVSRAFFFLLSGMKQDLIRGRREEEEGGGKEGALGTRADKTFLSGRTSERREPPRPSPWPSPRPWTRPWTGGRHPQGRISFAQNCAVRSNEEIWQREKCEFVRETGSHCTKITPFPKV